MRYWFNFQVTYVQEIDAIFKIFTRPVCLDDSNQALVLCVLNIGSALGLISLSKCFLKPE